jgi:hypothetical protein
MILRPFSNEYRQQSRVFEQVGIVLFHTIHNTLGSSVTDPNNISLRPGNNKMDKKGWQCQQCKETAVDIFTHKCEQVMKGEPTKNTNNKDFAKILKDEMLGCVEDYMDTCDSYEIGEHKVVFKRKGEVSYLIFGPTPLAS